MAIPPSVPLSIRAEAVDVPALLAELEAWVRIESPSSETEAVNRMGDRIAAHCARLGLACSRLPGLQGRGDMLVAHHGPAATPEAPGVLVLAHHDTVHPLGTLSGPLPWSVEGDIIRGPGVYDMKAGALMALEALRLARAHAGADLGPVTIVFVPDEELGSRSARARIETLAAAARIALVVEPAREGGRIVIARKGTANYDITLDGRASHAGTRPQDGRSAITAAAHMILELEALADHAKGTTVSVGMIQGGTSRNTIPAQCRLSVAIRLPTEAEADRVTAAMAALRPRTPDIEVRIAGGISRPAFSQSPASARLFDHAARHARDLGFTLDGMYTGGGSDGNFTAGLGIPTLDGLGADGAGAHTLEEHVFLSSIAPRTALLARLMINPL